MKRQVTWLDVVTRGNDPNTRFGDIEITRRDGSVLRGPVKGIRREGNEITIDFIWAAERKTPQSDWTRQTPESITVTYLEGQPFFDGLTVEVYVPEQGDVKLFKKGAASYLDPSEVPGLLGEEVRQSRAWMYDIPLDSTWEQVVDRVVDDLGADGLTGPEEQMQVQDEADTFGGKTAQATS